MSNDQADALYPARDWRPVLQRVEPLRANRSLLVWARLIRHRWDQGRAALLTECLICYDSCHDLEPLGR
jgi:hypothetical protein